MKSQNRISIQDQRDLLQVKIAELGVRLNDVGRPKFERDRDHAQLLQSINQHTRLVRDLARQPLVTGAGK